MKSFGLFVVTLMAIVFAGGADAATGLLATASETAESHVHGVDGSLFGLWTVIPFMGILLSIALFPIFLPKFWHHHYGKIAGVWGIIGACMMIFMGEANGGGFHRTLQSAFHTYVLEYIPFIVLLLGLFTIAGGIYVKGDMKGTPLMNTIFLAVGAAIASWVGTTGASMLMIHPVLRANKKRKRKVHIIVFFIFLVSNIGGALTPMGDPPLFLGFLKGVPFAWTFHLFFPMVILMVALLLIFFAIDTFIYRREKPQFEEIPVEKRQSVGLQGKLNFVWLAGLVAVVIAYGSTQKTIFFYESGAVQQEQRAVETLEHLKERVETDSVADVYDDAVEFETAWAWAVDGDFEEAVDFLDPLKEGERYSPAASRETLAAIDDPKVPKVRKEVLVSYAPVTEALESGDKDAEEALLTVLDQRIAAVDETTREQAIRSVHFGHIGHLPFSNIFREIVILLMAICSLLTTKKFIREANSFNWEPILEVAKLFAGIFICMVPALAILQAGSDGSLGFLIDNVTSPARYFWVTGLLSSFLDNAPTYLVFFETAKSSGMTEDLVAGAVPISQVYLLAISCGAVFMGANSYIGNAPNFMVKAIAEQNDVKMPGFLGYLLWSFGILVPLFALLTLIFFMSSSIL